MGFSSGGESSLSLPISGRSTPSTQACDRALGRAESRREIESPFSPSTVYANTAMTGSGGDAPAGVASTREASRGRGKPLDAAPVSLDEEEQVLAFRTRRILWGVERTVVVLLSERLREGRREESSSASPWPNGGSLV